MPIYKEKESKTITYLTVGVLLIILIVGGFSLNYFWRVFTPIYQIKRQEIRAAVAHFDISLIKEVAQELEKKNKP